MCWHVVLLSLLKQKMFVAPRFSLVDDEGRFQHLFINFPMMNKKAVEFFPEPKMADVICCEPEIHLLR